MCARATCTPSSATQAASLLRHGWRQLLYLSVAVTATANLLQAFGQQRVGAAEAAVIYTMDPVYGALFAWLLLGERLHAQGAWLHARTHPRARTHTSHTHAQARSPPPAHAYALAHAPARACAHAHTTTHGLGTLLDHPLTSRATSY